MTRTSAGHSPGSAGSDAAAVLGSMPPAAVVATAAYAGAQMLSDVASVKIGVIGGLAVDMGTFVYPLTFTLRDLVHKTLGRSNARVLIVTVAAANLAMAAYLRWVASVPSDAGWGLGDEFARVMTPVSRIVVASILAELVAELADTEVYHWFVTRVTKRHQWSRVLVSNSVSVPLDSLLFAVLAFAPLPALPGLAWAAVMDILLFNVAVKYAVTLVSLPLIYATPEPRPDARP